MKFYQLINTKLCVALATVLCVNSLVSGQSITEYDLEMQAKHAEEKGYDPSYRVNYFENIILRTTLTSDVANFQFSNIDSGATVNLRPAAESLLGFSIDYKWIALGVSFAPSFLISQEDEDLQNNSEALKFNLNFFYSDRWRQELSYTYNKGFIIETNVDFPIEDLNLLKNTELQILEGSTFFIANKNYSFRAHYAQTERQLKSAGSLIPKIRYSYGVTNFNVNSNFSTLNTSKINSFDIIGTIGYLYTFVLNQIWFATLGAHPGYGYNYSEYNNSDMTVEVFNSDTFTFKGEFSVGYNSYRWFFGMSGFWRNYNNTTNQNNELNRDASFFMAHLGYRFNDNKPMRKFFGWFEEHLGF